MPVGSTHYTVLGNDLVEPFEVSISDGPDQTNPILFISFKQLLDAAFEPSCLSSAIAGKEAGTTRDPRKGD
jgi:hypothetical protein